MREKNILITLLEELGITLLCRNESRATQLHSKREWSLLFCVDVKGKQLNCTLTGNGYYSPVSQPEENVTFMFPTSYRMPRYISKQPQSLTKIELMLLSVKSLFI